MNTIDQETRTWVEKLYTGIHMSIAGISEATGIDQEIIANLVSENNWDDRRLAVFTAKQQQLAQLYKMMDQLTNNAHITGTQTSLKDADLIKKYAAAISELEFHDELARIIPVAIAFTNWMFKRDLQATKFITHHFDEYIRSLKKSNTSRPKAA